MHEIKIYTDGACKGNPGPGGWGAILMAGDLQKEIFGGDPDTTNNRMEMTACIEALRLLKRPCTLELHTDSKYVIDGITSWIDGWKSKGWRTSSKQPVKNEDLWRELDVLATMHDIKWTWVRGHNGDHYNERADELANLGVVSGSEPRVPIKTEPATGKTLELVLETPTNVPIAVSNNRVTVITDGSCLGNPGPGGWAAIIVGNGTKHEIYGGESNTTNNRMELVALIRALEETSADFVRVVTDSKYVLDGATKWMPGWKAKRWKTADGGPVKNVDLWKLLDMCMVGRTFQFEWVKGHSGHPDNERCDELARAESAKIRASEKSGGAPAMLAQ